MRGTAPATYGRPTRYSGGKMAPRRKWLPSTIEATGRSVCANWDYNEGGFIIGIDVACPSTWDAKSHIFKNMGAGLAFDGSVLSQPLGKSPFVMRNTAEMIILAGANGSGGIFQRAIAATSSTLKTTAYHGEVQEGAGTNPRTAGPRLGCTQSTRSFLSCIKTSGGGRGIAKTDTVGGTWADWAFGTSRQYTAIVPSINYTCLYAGSDGTVAATDGVWIMKGTSSGTATIVQLDTIGGSAPTLADVRDVFCVSRLGIDYVYAVVGTTTDRGVWECKITHDPEDVGFVAATHVTWRRVFTCDDTANDRPQSMVAWYDDATDKLVGVLGHFSSNVTATGTYSQSTGAVENYYRTHYRCLDLLNAAPSWANISSTQHVSTQTNGIDNKLHNHVITVEGEPSVEKARLGGSQYTCQGLAVSPALDDFGLRQVISVGKTTPWILSDAMATTPVWRPHSYGLGALAGGYQARVITEHSQGWMACTDDDRGGFLMEHGAPAVFRWCLANDVSGLPTTNNATFSLALSYLGAEDPNGGLLYGARNSCGYRVKFPFSPPAAQDVTYLGTGAFAEANATSVSISPPAAALPGDLLIMYGMTRNQAAGSWPAQTGWVEMSGHGMSQSTNQRADVWYRYMQDTDTTWTLTAAGSGTVLGAISAWRGVTPSPEDVAGVKDAGTPAATFTMATPIVPVTDRAVVVTLGSTSDANALSMTTANGYTLAYGGAGYDSVLGTSGALIGAYKLVTPPGSALAPVFTETALGNDGWIIYQYALRPIGTGAAQQAILVKDYNALLGGGAFDLIGFYDWLDSGANKRYIGVDAGRGIIRSAAGGGSADTIVSAFTCSSKRTVLCRGSAGVFFIMVPDKGVYRTTDYGATWVLWWDNAVTPSPQDHWFGHIANNPATPNDLWVTFGSGGVWKAPSANTAAVGSGTAGSVPAGAAKVTGGSVGASDHMGAIGIDPFFGHVWCMKNPQAANTPATLHRLPYASGTTWKEEVSREIQEGAHLSQHLDIYAGFGLIPTNGQGLLRRVC